MKFQLTIRGKKYQIEINPNNRGGTEIKIGDKKFIFREEEKGKKVSLAKPSLPKRNFSEKTIKAPIGGVVSDIFVKEGSFIKKGRKVALLSAMKMENEIITESEGRIKKINVKKDQRVQEGDALIVLE